MIFAMILIHSIFSAPLSKFGITTYFQKLGHKNWPQFLCFENSYSLKFFPGNFDPYAFIISNHENVPGYYICCMYSNAIHGSRHYET